MELQYRTQALEAYRASGVQHLVAEELFAIGSLFYDQGETDKALDYFNQALAIQRRRSDRIDEAHLVGSIGAVQEKLGNYQQALDLYKQAIAIDESVRSATNVAELRSGVEQEFVLLSMRLDLKELAFQFSEQSRARILLDQVVDSHANKPTRLNANLVSEERDREAELKGLEQALNALQNQPQAEATPSNPSESISALQSKLALKQREYEDLLNRIRAVDPEYASLRTSKLPSLSAIQRRLDPRTTLLSYFVTPETTIAFVITNHSFQALPLSVKEDDLRNEISVFRDFATLSELQPDSIRVLYDRLIRPLKKELTTPILGIVPHGILHYLPFAALADGEAYLGDRYSLFYLPSVSLLPVVLEERKHGGSELLALANSRSEGLPFLDYADSTAERVAALYHTRALVGDTATESALISRAKDYSILFLAAHATLNATAPLFSRIVLAPDSQNDGFLDVRHIYELNLRKKTDLVVLSACRTVLGKQSSGDDIIGLNRAFIYAGSPSVIASLWSVRERQTGDLMESFFGHLHGGMCKADALRAAQSETRAKYPHPYFWASFVLTGDPGDCHGSVTKIMSQRR
jgi:CHAT domain-containing protein